MATPDPTSVSLEQHDPTAILDGSEAGSRIVRGGLVRGVGYAASTLLSLVGIILLTNYLGVERFGQYQTVISLITVVGAVTDAGMATLGLREYAQLRGGRRDELMRQLLGLRLALTAVGVAVAVLLAIVLGYEGPLLLGTLLAGGGLVLTVVQTTLSIPLGAGLRSEALASLDLLRQVLTVGSIAALVGVGSGVAALLGIPMAVGFVVVGATALLVRGAVPLMPTFQPRAWLILLRSAIAFSMATAVGTIYTYAAQILTAVTASETQSGLFAAAFRVFIVTAAIPGLLVTVAFPLLSRAARDDRDRLAYALQRLFEVTSLMGIGAAVGLALGAPFVIEVMAGPDFAGSVTPLRVLGIAMLGSFVLAPWGFALLSLHLHRPILRANAAAFVVSVIAVVTLASVDGARGAAIGATLGETTLAVGYLRALTKGDPRFQPNVARPLRALACAIPALIVLTMGLPSAVALVIGLGLYAVLLIPSGAVPDELVDLMRVRIQRAPPSE